MGGIHIFLRLFFLCYIISLSNALFSFEIFTSSKAVGETLAGGKDLGGGKAIKAATDAIDKWIVTPYDTYDKMTSVQSAINDIITVLNHTQGVDSVLAVNKNDYDKCNINNPITKMDDGNFDTLRPLYFIAGNKPNCDQGQKFALVVKSDSLAASPPADSLPADSPPPPSFAATTLTPSVAVVASVWVVTSLALGSFVTTY